MSENKSVFNYVEVEKLKENKKELAILCIILGIAILALAVWLTIVQGNNAEMKIKLEQKDKVIAAQWTVINGDNKTIEDLQDTEKELTRQLAECNTGKEKLSREKEFLFPWGSEIANRVDDTVDFRFLTSIACDDIARWLIGKIGEFRKFYKEGGKWKN